MSKYNIGSFPELVLAVLEQLMKIGQEIISGVLRQRDTELLIERDASRFRGTAFGNYVAIPHPNQPVGDESFAVTGLLVP